MRRSVSIDEVRSARLRIAGRIIRTPLIAAQWAKGDLWLKAENLQPTGSFKIRGTLNAMAQISPDVQSRGVVAHARGHQGPSLAWAAREIGASATIVMPETTAYAKVEAARSLGAEAFLVPEGQLLQAAESLSAEQGLTMFPPFNHPDVIAGHGTLAPEILEDLDHVDTVLVPIDRGGLTCGVGAAISALSPRTRVVGVAPHLAGNIRDSLRKGHRVAAKTDSTHEATADSAATPVGEMPDPLMQEAIEETVTVSEREILAAAGLLIRRSRLAVGPSGALGVAAHLADPEQYGRVVTLLNAGNTEPSFLTHALISAEAHGTHGST